MTSYAREKLKPRKLLLLASVVGLLMVACNTGDGITLTAALRGEEAVGTGVADIEIRSDGTELCWNIRGLVGSVDDVTAMHIHSGSKGESGPVVVEFISGNQGCTEVGPGGLIEESDVRDMAEAPANFYVDVHSRGYPDGAVRGQLERKGGGR
jgi:CHRD domain